MRRCIAVFYAGLFGLSASGVAAQAPRREHIAALRAAYDTLSPLLPPGPRVLVVDDPFASRGLEAQDAADLASLNRELATVLGLPSARLAAVRVCAAPGDCSFVDGVVATVCLAVASLDTDTATIHAATRYFIDSKTLKERVGVAWAAVALREVRLKRGSAGWEVVSVLIRAES